MASLTVANSLQQWLSWLETLHPKTIELGLDRINQVAEKLNLLNAVEDNKIKIITVAGTNGKGTCVAALQALLLAANKSVGAYTSPHLLRYNERIAVDGDFVTDQQIVDVFVQIDQARGDVSLSYFEFGTLAACLVFLKAGVEYWVLEVGLGGRLDAVNLFNADIAIVTSIDLDHQDWLGDDREKIGFEKAGIFRSGKPAICVDPNPPRSLIDHAKKINAQFIANDKVTWLKQGADWQWQGVDLKGEPIIVNALPSVQLPIASLSAALQAIVLLEIDITHHLICQTLETLQLPGRCQQFMAFNRHFILDVAHNPAAANNLARQLREIQSDRKINARVLAIFAVMSDKDINGIVTAMADLIDHWFVTDLENNPRAASSAELSVILKNVNLAVYQNAALTPQSVSNAIETAINVSTEGDIVLVFGSFYTVAEALQWRHAHENEINDG